MDNKIDKRVISYFNNFYSIFPLEQVTNLEGLNQNNNISLKASHKIKVDNVYTKVLPSLVSKYYKQSLPAKTSFDPDQQPYICLFDKCFINPFSPTRRALITHFIEYHDTQLPCCGKFLDKPFDYGFKNERSVKSIK